MSDLVQAKKEKKNTNDRITVEALKFYVPLFQAGDAAEDRLNSDEEITPEERNSLEARAKLKDLSVEKISSLAGPLITREINKIISKSHLNGKEDSLFDLLYYASRKGLIKGLRHFDVDKLDASATNYLFQWITTYAKKELAVVEAAPYGVAPSRFQRYKKISAVRKKLTESLNRYATNEEVLDYFHSGQADLATMNGRKGSSDKPSGVNRQMTLDIIAEQENFEKNLITQNLLDPLEDYSAETKLSRDDDAPFAESLFGVFIASHNFTLKARIVMLSELQSNDFTEIEYKELDKITTSENRKISSMWKELLKDPKGPFYSFLKRVDPNGFDDFDVLNTIKVIEDLNLEISPDRWAPLFNKGKVEVV